LERLSTFLLENEIFSLRIPSEAQELDRASLILTPHRNRLDQFCTTISKRLVSVMTSTAISSAPRVARPASLQRIPSSSRTLTASSDIETRIGNHTFRATGITAYLKNSGKLEVAQQIAI
jgi:hypothetical protein